jgi:hypothetical protein
VVDYPIHALLNRLIDSAERTGTYLAVLVVIGGAFWFLVGTLVAHTGRSLRQIFIAGRPATDRM